MTIHKGQMVFDGADYIAQRDQQRLAGQILRVYEVMADGRWRTLRELADASGAPEASASAQLRNLRKARFGRHEIQRQLCGASGLGLYEYRLIVEPKGSAH